MTAATLWRGWAAAFAVGMTLILALGGKGPAAPAARNAPAPALALPDLPAPAADAADKAELAKSLIWGADAKVTEKKEPPPAWSLSGVFAVNQWIRVTVRFDQDKQPPRHLGEGDALPDGRKIRAIERDRVRVADEDGKEEWLGLNQRVGDAR